MPKIRKLSLVCRACGAPVHMPEAPAQDVMCHGCGARLGTLAELGLARAPSSLSVSVARRLRALMDG